MRVTHEKRQQQHQAGQLLSLSQSRYRKPNTAWRASHRITKKIHIKRSFDVTASGVGQHYITTSEPSFYSLRRWRMAPIFAVKLMHTVVHNRCSEQLRIVGKWLHVRGDDELQTVSIEWLAPKSPLADSNSTFEDHRWRLGICHRRNPEIKMGWALYLALHGSLIIGKVGVSFGYFS